MTKIHGNSVAPFRFLTPFPHHRPQGISEGQWVKKTVWKAERAWFRTEEVRRAKPGIEPFLTRPSVDNIVAEKRCLGDPRGYDPLVAGRTSEKGRQRVARKQTSVGRGKAERFPLQGGSVRLNLKGRSFHSRVFYPHYLEENRLIILEWFVRVDSGCIVEYPFVSG